MGIYPKLFIIFIALIKFKIGSINGADPPEPSTSYHEDLPSSVSSSESDEEVIVKYTLNTSLFYHPKIISNTIYTYYISEVNQPLLKYPSHLEQIKFNNNIFVFEDPILLIDDTEWTFAILTCKHKNVLLIGMYQVFDYIFYSPDPETGKWVNYVPGFPEKYRRINEHGLKCFRLDEKSNLVTFLVDLYKECAKLNKRLCKGDDCTPYDKSNEDLSVEFTARSPKSLLPANNREDNGECSGNNAPKPVITRNIIDSELVSYTVNLKLSHYGIDTPLSRFQYYTISERDQPKFKYPYMIKQVKFFDNLLVFDDGVFMPNFNNWSVDVLTCKNNTPILIRIHSSSEFTFFSVDNSTGKWHNCKIEELSICQSVDKNGVISYTIREKDDYIIFFYNMFMGCSSISDQLCKSNPQKNYNLTGDISLEVEVVSA